ncbi:c2h2-type zinc finger transcription factor [Gigaspora margarita]|uniref:C2h2-type zinc finger transcription factor n=1 Tax=Gigaspora margarita TaxID=4874 RepID=A0A8H4EPN8_GIGMA|nr:c2h2-type zinc finger transcription factor [Gigaspora margarita]
MSKVDNFKLEAQPNSGISNFFFMTAMKWWCNIESFTNFVYMKDPTLTAIQVFDRYTRNLIEIAAIKNIVPNVIQYINDLLKNLVVKFTFFYYGMNVNDEINNFFQSPPEKQSSNLFQVIESVNDELVESEYETDENKCDKAPPKIDKLAFHEAHNAIPDASKMRLKSGRVVEDVLFNYVKDKDYEDETEWDELTSDRLGIPSLPQEIAKELARYAKNSLKKLCKIVNTPYLQDGVDYDVQQHYNLEWIQMSIRALVNLYENVDLPLVRNQSEDWFTVFLFGTCIDMCMRNVQLGTDVKRTDAPSLASTNRKNHNRPNNARKLMGQKIDGVVYIINQLLEVGAIEAARSFEGESNKKYISENFKMPKTLRDMLADHIQAVGYDGKKINQIQVFGILHLGLRIQFTRLWRAGGSITIFRKDPQLYYLDNKFSAEGIKTFLKFLAAVYRYKQIIKDNLDILNSKANYDIESSEEDLLNELMGVDRLSTPPPSSRLVKYFADCWRTPKIYRSPKSKKKQKLKE